MTNFFRQYIRKCLETILGDEYDLLKDYFEVIINDAADYIIFISRRCFVLYQIFAYIGGWQRDHIISDKGIWTFRKQIRQAHRIILADDILIWGSAMRTADILLRSILNTSEEYVIKRVIYCQYAENDSEDVAELQTFYKRSMRECRILTNKCAKGIMTCGIPYTTFLYPFYGKSLNSGIQIDEEVVTFKSIKATEGKWKSYYDFRFDKKLQSMLECLCDGASIRYYYQSQENLLCVIPFAFISDIKAEHIEFYYSNISECCRKSGWQEIATEIEEAIADVSDEKWQYLAMLLSCLISRIIGVIGHVDKKFDGEYDRVISKKSLEGAFSTQIYNCLERLSEESCLCFVDQILLRREMWGSCLLRLPKEEGNGDIDVCLDELLIQFGEMRLLYETSHESKDKKVTNNELYKMYSGKYPCNIIQAAQIECCDAGIVTYGFDIEKGIGSVAKYGIGERSSVLFSLRYEDIIHRYYIVNSEAENQKGVLSDQQRRNNLAKVLQEAGVTEEESKIFWSHIQNSIDNVYDHYLNC